MPTRKLAKTLDGGGFPGRGDPKSCHVKARCKPSRRDAIVRLHVRIIRLSALRPPVHERLAAVEIDRDYRTVPSAGYVFREDGALGPRPSLGKGGVPRTPPMSAPDGTLYRLPLLDVLRQAGAIL